MSINGQFNKSIIEWMDCALITGTKKEKLPVGLYIHRKNKIMYYPSVQMNPLAREFFGSAFFMFTIAATRGNAMASAAALFLCIFLLQASVNPFVVVGQAMLGKISQQDILPLCIAEALGFVVAIEVFRRFFR